MDSEAAPANGRLAEQIDAVMGALCHPDPVEAEIQLARLLSPTFTVIRPDIVADGPSGLREAYSALRHDLHPVTLVRTSVVEEHHDHFRFAWSMLEDGRTVGSGCDFGRADAAGRIEQLVSFPGTDPPPR